MADAVTPGATINPEPDFDEVIAQKDEGDDSDPLAGGGGKVQGVDEAREATGTGNDENGPQSLHTAQDLTEDAKQD